MKKITAFIVVLLFFANAAKAQYVNIPDSNFRNFLKSKYPSCFNSAGMMDTNCIKQKKVEVLYLSNLGLSNINGIQYFTSLRTLHFAKNFLSGSPKFPNSLKYFDCSNNNISVLPTTLPDSLETLDCSANSLNGLSNLPKNLLNLNCAFTNTTVLNNIPTSLLKLDCSSNKISSFSNLPVNLKVLICANDSLKSLNNLPNSLEELYCFENQITNLSSLPSELKVLHCYSNKLTNLSGFNDSLKELLCYSNQLTSLSNFPQKLERLHCYYNKLTNLSGFNDSLKELLCYNNQLTSLSNLPKNLKTLYCYDNKLISITGFNDKLTILRCSNNQLVSLSNLPQNLKYLYCNDNKLSSILHLGDSLKTLVCYNNQLTQLTNLPPNIDSLRCQNNLIKTISNLPTSLKIFNCSNNKLDSLPQLPSLLRRFECQNNQIGGNLTIPQQTYYVDCSNNKLIGFNNFSKNANLNTLDCSWNLIANLPAIPSSLSYLTCDSNAQLTCLPYLPKMLHNLSISGTGIKCVPNKPTYLATLLASTPLCVPTNNVNQCKPFPIIQGRIFKDLNGNFVKDSNEYYVQNIKVKTSNSNFSYTKKDGSFQLATDSLGNYTLIVAAPTFYNSVPAAINIKVNGYDTLVNLPDIALQPNILKDSLSITATPINFAARPGFKYAYLIKYENVGTTAVATNINFNYDNALLNYDSSSNNSVVKSGSSLSLNAGNLVPGQIGSFVAYFRVNTAAVLGTSLWSVAAINGGTSNAVDSVKSIIRGSYDPNDKQATTSLTTQQVTDGYYINYTVRFQNTGTDTAFNVVIADTLSSMLEANNLQMVSSSHPCKTTIKNNKVYFEFFDIYLPDSATNKVASNGFVTFKVKPVSTVVAGNIIPNKAYIYFDYNKSVLTNIATTVISHPLPLKLLDFSGALLDDRNIAVHWNTANEINTAYFVLEQSVDGRNFNAVAQIEAKGFGNNQYAYFLKFIGTVFLRLKIVDKDGSLAYSSIIKISQNPNIVINVSPNPATNYLDINVNSSKLNNTIATLYNNLGIAVKTFTLHQGYQKIKLDGLANGLYYLQTALQSSKVLVEK